jgi:predicted GNAT family acetyltransferase
VPKRSVLDNVVWHSLIGPHAALGDRTGLAARFHRDVAPFSAIEEPSEAAWDDLVRLVGPGKPAVLFAPDVTPPRTWTAEARLPCLQMVADGVSTVSSELELIELGAADVPEMIELVGATNPGPFGPRTIELGTYLGHRSDGVLVAMAGERVRATGYTEISVVCTAATHRGRGLAGALVRELVGRIRARGDEAFLHVMTDNTPAISLYEAMGFSVRTQPEAVVVRHTG